MMRKLSWISNKTWLNKDSISAPSPIINTIPEWFRKADRFAKNEQTGEYWEMPRLGGKVPTWKACPAIMDVMGTGYTLKTPCDLEFFINDRGHIDVKVLDPSHIDFISYRPPMPQFQVPMGYDEHHFAWYSDWGLRLPEGYSALYISPQNRFELPFLTVSGIIDADKVNFPGTIPVFFIKGWTGILPAGTPYFQMIPFKREDWESNHELQNPMEIHNNNAKNSMKFRVPDGGVYKNSIWEPRKYS
jgi:hypothetical protein